MSSPGGRAILAGSLILWTKRAAAPSCRRNAPSAVASRPPLIRWLAREGDLDVGEVKQVHGVIGIDVEAVT